MMDEPQPVNPTATKKPLIIHMFVRENLFLSHAATAVQDEKVRPSKCRWQAGEGGSEGRWMCAAKGCNTWRNGSGRTRACSAAIAGTR